MKIISKLLVTLALLLLTSQSFAKTYNGVDEKGRDCSVEILKDEKNSHHGDHRFPNPVEDNGRGLSTYERILTVNFSVTRWGLFSNKIEKYNNVKLTAEWNSMWKLYENHRVFGGYKLFEDYSSMELTFGHTNEDPVSTFTWSHPTKDEVRCKLIY